MKLKNKIHIIENGLDDIKLTLAIHNLIIKIHKKTHIFNFSGIHMFLGINCLLFTYKNISLCFASENESGSVFFIGINNIFIPINRKESRLIELLNDIYLKLQNLEIPFNDYNDDIELHKYFKKCINDYIVFLNNTEDIYVGHEPEHIDKLANFINLIKFKDV